MQPSAPFDALLKHLAAGSTGVLSVDLVGAPVRVHVACGQVLAATSEHDAGDILHRMVHTGLLDPDRVAGLKAALTEGGTLSELLAGSVPYESILASYTARFEENLACFLLARAVARYEGLPGDGVPRLGSDPSVVLLRARALAERARVFVEEGDAWRLIRGPTPARREDAGLVALVEDGACVREVLESSPEPPIATAARLRDLVDLGVLAAEKVPIVDEVPAAPDPSLVEASVEERFCIDPEKPAGLGEFVVEKHLLDYVDLEDGTVERSLDPEADILLEMEDGETAGAHRFGVVTLAIGGPTLSREEAWRKAEVTNEVLRVLASEFQEIEGPGAGWVRILSLLQAAPMRYLGLFRGVTVQRDGSLDIDTLTRNLEKRPDVEQRRMLNGALQDLVERSLTLAAERMDGPRLDGMLTRVAGFQKRLGL
ncbi:MAG: hypothetical protein JXB39_05010 [Deltaproteobacteria bacterium]|nr:hypothetical protein [Deltaproteobacteria bacterium]